MTVNSRNIEAGSGTVAPSGPDTPPETGEADILKMSKVSPVYEYIPPKRIAFTDVVGAPPKATVRVLPAFALLLFRAPKPRVDSELVTLMFVRFVD
jgi:hypothetical protein